MASVFAIKFKDEKHDTASQETTSFRLHTEHPEQGDDVKDILPNGITCVSPRVSPVMRS